MIFSTAQPHQQKIDSNNSTVESKIRCVILRFLKELRIDAGGIFTNASGLHSQPPMYGEQPSVSLCAENQVALQFPVASVFPRSNALRAVSVELWLKTQRCVFLVCFATLIFEFILRGWCFAMSKRYLHSFGNDNRIQHFSRRIFLVALIHCHTKQHERF